MGERWGRVPAGVPSAQAGVYRALSMIAGRRGETTCRMKVIAEGAGRSIRRTQVALRRLEDLGWLRIQARPGRSSTYFLYASQAATQAVLGFVKAPVIPIKASPLPRDDAASGVIPPGRVTESSGGGDGNVRGGVTETSGVTRGERAASLGSRATSGYTVGGERVKSKEVPERIKGKQEQTASLAGDEDLEPLPRGASDLIHRAGVSVAVVMRERRRRPAQPEWIIAALLAVLAAQEVRTVRKPDAYFTRITTATEPPNDKLLAHAKRMMEQARAERSRGNATLLFGRGAG